MQGGLLMIVALVSGLVTVIFILNGLRQVFVRHRTLGMRALVMTTVVGLLTGAFTVWQLVVVAQQLHFSR